MRTSFSYKYGSEVSNLIKKDSVIDVDLYTLRNISEKVISKITGNGW